MNRRYFLKSSGLALVGGALLPNVFVRMAEAGFRTLGIDIDPVALDLVAVGRLGIGN